MTCDQNASCNNTIGTFVCICNHGYDGTGLVCTGNASCYDPINLTCLIPIMCVLNQDVDECATNMHTCDVPQRAMCTNTDGSFNCECRPGYTGNGFLDNCSKS